ncbi:MAG: DUF1446 domain-containing protein [Actinobacteria bacterium]|nr:DUF1446 domain-containing protein [Actinomycetota bacterium]
MSAAIGSGSIGEGDRIGPGVALAESGLVRYMGFDCLAERTLALAEARRVEDEATGQDERMGEFVERYLGFLGSGGKMVGNFGAANPDAAVADAVTALRGAGLSGTPVGVVRGDDVIDAVLEHDVYLPERGCTARAEKARIVSAHAYIGADTIVHLLDEGARLVIGGRIADASVFVGPICHELGWALDDWDRVAVATLAGHLLEGGAGRTLDAYPMAVVSDDGVEITRQPGTGPVPVDSVKRAVAHEVHDPATYLTPDVVADFTDVVATQAAPDRVRFTGARGAPKPESYKVLVALDLGWKLVAEISLGGHGCVDRARATEGLMRRFLEPFASDIDEMRFDIHGVNALFGAQHGGGTPADVRLRMAVRCPSREAVDAVTFEANQMWLSGGGGLTRTVERAIGVTPALLPRTHVPLETEVVVA